jgi:hypothetical protein
MNIKSRLKTIERKIYKEISVFCLCYGLNLKYEIIPITIDEWKKRFDSGEETAEKLPNFCERCRKPIDKRFIETTFEQIQENRRQRMNQVMETMCKFSDN